MTHRILLGVILTALPMAVFAAEKSPYAGEETREIKALSRQEVSGYLEGRGMGYAKAAELNHHPGPRHVLDLARELGLAKEQIERTEAIFAAMKSRAMALGKRLVEHEAELDRRFASGAVDPAALRDLVAKIGSLHAELRYVHLNAHIELRAVLTSRQIQKYDELRGYGKAGQRRGHGHSRGH